MSSEESKIVYKHQENLVKTFFSITDESIGMRHFRYTNDDYFSADESIKSCGQSELSAIIIATTSPEDCSKPYPVAEPKPPSFSLLT